MTSSCGTTLI